MKYDMGETMRRLLALVALIALVGTACGTEDETSESTTTTTAVTTATAGGSTEVPDAPRVFIAEGGSNVIADPTVTLAGPYGDGHISISVLPVTPADFTGPVPNQPVGEQISENWMVLPPGQGDCAYRKGQILISRLAAAELADDDDPSDPDDAFLIARDTVIGTLAGEDILLANVKEGLELQYISQAIDQGGMASYHYPVAPLPIWKYGPAAPRHEVEPIDEVGFFDITEPTGDGTSTSDPLQIVLDDGDPTVVVLDRFVSPDVPAELEVSSEATRGHGEFIVGILARMGVQSDPKNVVLSDDTVGSEVTVATTLVGTEGQVTNLSMGIAPCEVTIEGLQVALPPIGVAAAMRDRAEIPDSQPIVAAAGNHGTDNGCSLPWFPAYFAGGEEAWASYRQVLAAAGAQADPATDLGQLDADISLLATTTIGVGSTDASPFRNRASFSSCDSVGNTTVWAPGTDVISDFDGGLAVWSGTSFATPQIAAAIALKLSQP